MRTRISKGMWIVLLTVLSVTVAKGQANTLNGLFEFCTSKMSSANAENPISSEEISKLLKATYHCEFIGKENGTYEFRIYDLLPPPIILLYQVENHCIKSIAIGCKDHDNFIASMYQFEQALKYNERFGKFGNRFKLVQNGDFKGCMLRKSEGIDEHGRVISLIFTAIPNKGALAVAYNLENK